MPTTSQGVYYPDAATNIAPLHTVFSTMASSINDILAGDVQVHRVANVTQRASVYAQYGASAANPLFVWRADGATGRALEYTLNGVTWHTYSSSEDDSGWVAVAPASGFTSNRAAARRIGSVVYLRGTLTGTISTASATTVGVIPAGFRPVSVDDALGIVLTASASNNIFWSRITTAGEIGVIAAASGSSTIRLSGLSGYLVD